MVSAAIFFTCVNCSAQLPAQPTPPPSSLVLLYGLTSCQALRAGSIVRFSALVYDDGLYQYVNQSAVTWSTSNPAVLTTQSGGGGFFTLVGVGTAEARGLYQGRSAAVVVTVPAGSTLPYLEVTANSNSARVDLRASFSSPTTNVTSSASFTSSDSRIATVEGSRVVLQGPIGNTEIRATASGLAGACAMSVDPRSF